MAHDGVHGAGKTLLDELKTHQHGPCVVLRSQTPTGSARRCGPTCACTTPSVAHARAPEEIVFELLPPRRLRANARVVKRNMPNYAVKRAEHRKPPQPTTGARTPHP